MGKLVFIESSYTGAGVDCARIGQAIGHEVVLLCRSSEPYRFADELGITTVECDTRDFEAALKAVASLEGVAGVGTTDEYSTVIAGQIARSLNLPHADDRSLRACRNKLELRRVLPHRLSPKWRSVADEDAAVIAANDVGYPVVLKPTNLTGSALVARCSTEDELRAAVKQALAAQPSVSTPSIDGLLVEEFVDGAEFSVEFFDGEVLGVTRKHLSSKGGFVELGHDFPADLDEPVISKVVSAALAAVKTVGMDWGPAHLELRLNASGAYIMEINARIPGDQIPRVVEYTLGFSFARAYVHRILGMELPERMEPKDRGAAIRMWHLSVSGILRNVSGADDVTAAEGVQDVAVKAGLGDRYELTHSNLDRVGFVIATGASTAAAALRADEAHSLLELEWEELPSR